MRIFSDRPARRQLGLCGKLDACYALESSADSSRRSNCSAILPGRSRMAKQKTTAAKRRKPPVGEKRQFLTSMDPDVIKSVKSAALEDDTTASAIIEEAAREWLGRRAS
jgi:hypothetical protein